MATQADNGAADQSRLRKLALPGAVAAAGAGIAFLLANKPAQGLRGLVSRLPAGADDLIGDLKGRVQSAGGGDTPRPSGQISQAQLDEFEKRRRERKKRRERRQQRAT